MIEPKSTSIAKAVEVVLKDIYSVRGYNTDLGANVYRGFYSHAIDSDKVNYPLVAIQPDTETVEDSRQGKDKITASFRLVAVTNDTDNPADILRACAADMRRAIGNKLVDELRETGVRISVELGSVEFAIAADSPTTLAAMSVGFSYIENYEAL